MVEVTVNADHLNTFLALTPNLQRGKVEYIGSNLFKFSLVIHGIRAVLTFDWDSSDFSLSIASLSIAGINLAFITRSMVISQLKTILTQYSVRYTQNGNNLLFAPQQEYILLNSVQFTEQGTIIVNFDDNGTS